MINFIINFIKSFFIKNIYNWCSCCGNWSVVKKKYYYNGTYFICENCIKEKENKTILEWFIERKFKLRGGLCLELYEDYGKFLEWKEELRKEELKKEELKREDDFVLI